MIIYLNTNDGIKWNSRHNNRPMILYAPPTPFPQRYFWYFNSEQTVKRRPGFILIGEIKIFEFRTYGGSRRWRGGRETSPPKCPLSGSKLKPARSVSLYDVYSSQCHCGKRRAIRSIPRITNTKRVLQNGLNARRIVPSAQGFIR